VALGFPVRLGLGVPLRLAFVLAVVALRSALFSGLTALTVHARLPGARTPGRSPFALVRSENAGRARGRPGERWGGPGLPGRLRTARFGGTKGRRGDGYDLARGRGRRWTRARFLRRWEERQGSRRYERERRRDGEQAGHGDRDPGQATPHFYSPSPFGIPGAAP
jgi:hypothetical protein